MSRPVLRSGAHPTAADLHKMRLGYPGYDSRLKAIQQRSPARYEAIMQGQKWFRDPHWHCTECGESDRSTRNLVCRVCTSVRAKRVFVQDERAGLLVYKPDNPNSGDWHARRQRNLYLADAERRLARVPAQRVGRFRLEAAQVWSGASVVLNTSALIECCDALLSGDTVRIHEHIKPLIDHDKALAVLVRAVAGALIEPRR